MKFEITLRGGGSYTKDGADELSKLGFIFKQDQDYPNSYFWDWEKKASVYINFKTIFGLIKFLRKHGHSLFEYDHKIPVITLD